jgi:hypothetical protein
MESGVVAAVCCVGIVLLARNKKLISNRPGISNTTSPYLRNGSLRFASLEAGEKKSGHISTAPNEGILFFDSEF